MKNITYYDDPLHSEEDTQSLKETESIAKEFKKIKLQKKIIEKINQGMLLDEIMDYIFSSFQILIPYERIGVAFLEDSSVISKWVKSKLSKILLGPGYHIELKGSTLENIINTGKPRIINNLPDYLMSNPSSISTKLIVEEGIVKAHGGQINVASKEGEGTVFTVTIPVNGEK